MNATWYKSFDPPVKEGVEVSKVRKSRSQDVFELTTSIGDYTADQVVIAAGSYHIPKVPKIAERLPEHIRPKLGKQRSHLFLGCGQIILWA
jgi:cation diffusion facilitator CzcD-associated flavoprotein CzcO